MTQFPHWGIDPFDIVWKNFLDTNSTFNSIENKINYPVDIYETDDGLRFELAVVGLEEEDVQILVEGDTIRITHDKKATEEGRIYIQRGITRRSFDLAYKIAAKFDLSRSAATLDKGLLIIDIPLSKEMAPRRVQIGSLKQIKNNK